MTFDELQEFSIQNHVRNALRSAIEGSELRMRYTQEACDEWADFFLDTVLKAQTDVQCMEQRRAEMKHDKS